MQLIYLGPLGPESSQLVGYLASLPGVVPLKPGHNPATWMLEVTGGAVATSARAAPLDFAAAYQVRPFSIAPFTASFLACAAAAILLQAVLTFHGIQHCMCSSSHPTTQIPIPLTPSHLSRCSMNHSINSLQDSVVPYLALC